MPMASDAAIDVANIATKIGFLVIAYILSSGREFVWSVCAYCKRMHRMGNEVAHAIEHRTMSRESRESRKMFRNNQQGKMPATGRCTGVAHVLRTVVGKLENDRRESCQTLLERAGHISCLRTLGLPCDIHCGSSMWRASISPCASANTRKSPIPPHTLKLTHV